MCKCHKWSGETKKTERVLGKSVIGSLLTGERFYFEHEGNNAIRVCVESSVNGYFCPLENSNEWSERNENVFHKHAEIIVISGAKQLELNANAN